MYLGYWPHEDRMIEQAIAMQKRGALAQCARAIGRDPQSVRGRAYRLQRYAAKAQRRAQIGKVTWLVRELRT